MSPDSIGSKDSDPRAPEAGRWFDFQVALQRGREGGREGGRAGQEGCVIVCMSPDSIRSKDSDPRVYQVCFPGREGGRACVKNV